MSSRVGGWVGGVSAAAAGPGGGSLAALAALPLGGRSAEELALLFAAVRAQSGWLAAFGNEVLCAFADSDSDSDTGADIGVQRLPPAAVALERSVDERWQTVRLGAAARMSTFE